ncbi:hypothetical protein GQ457_03G038820 [Hibiscus cannabinus]
MKAFSEALSLKSEGEYEVACEHAHSCCVLAKPKFSGSMAGAHMALIPSGAVYGAEEGGFDPDQSQYRKARHHKSKSKVIWN